MPLAVECPGCEARLTVPVSKAGKEMDCPHCGLLLAIPGWEVPAVARRPELPKTKRMASRDDDEEDDDERPVQRRSSTKTKKSGGRNNLLILAIVGGVLLLVLGGLGVGGWYLYTVLKGGKGTTVPSSTAPLSESQPGNLGTFREFRDARAGFGLNTPTPLTKWNVTSGGQNGDAIGHFHYSGPFRPNTLETRPNATLSVTSKPTPPGFVVGTQPKDYEELMVKYQLGFHFDPAVKKYETLERKMVSMGGSPAAELRYRERAVDFFGGTPKPEEVARVAREGECNIVFVGTNGKKLIIVRIESKGSYPDEAIPKAILESFLYLP